jgi:outer membrane scaffolding protein for murein synthesis (MipA/OmpV family)
MKYTKSMIFTASAACVIGAAGIGATALAVSNSSAGTAYPPIVQKLASTFGLDPAKVNDVFQKQHQLDESSHQAKFKAALDQAVKDKKLTQDQEDKLIAELKSLRDQFKADKTQGRQDFKTQLDQWAKDNGITNLDQILPAPPAGGHPMMHDQADGS